MTEQEAFIDLFNYYCGEEDSHVYIRESWKTLKSYVFAPKVGLLKGLYATTCCGIVIGSHWQFCPSCGKFLW